MLQRQMAHYQQQAAASQQFGMAPHGGAGPHQGFHDAFMGGPAAAADPNTFLQAQLLHQQARQPQQSNTQVPGA